ncbi:MAG: hypothetical protein WDO13_02230 [Verrucomicrobiota bacterium]
MKIKLLPGLVLALALTLLQTGCDAGRSPNLWPAAIRSSFDNVQVRVSGGVLYVNLQSVNYNLQNLHVTRAVTSSYAPPTSLTLVSATNPPGNPNEIDLAFTPAPSVPFNIDLTTTTAKGRTLRLRADYYGSHAIKF